MLNILYKKRKNLDELYLFKSLISLYVIYFGSLILFVYKKFSKYSKNV